MYPEASLPNHEKRVPMNGSISVAARAALECYGLSGADVVPLEGGKQTKNLFRVFCRRRGSFILRMYKPARQRTGGKEMLGANLRSEAGIRSQALWLSDLRSTARLPVPEPIPTSDGDSVGLVSDESDAGRQISLLLRWIPGRQARSADLTVQNAFLLGSYVGRLHLHAESYSPPESFVRPDWGVESQFGESSPYWPLAEAVLSGGEVDVLRSAVERIRQDLRPLRESREHFGLIHRDLQLKNIVSHQGTWYAIDFDHCGWGYYLYDLVLPYLGAEDLGERRNVIQGAMLKGYALQRHLPEDYREVMETCVAMQLMNRVWWAFSKMKGLRSDQATSHPAWKSNRVRDAVVRLAYFSGN